MDKFFGKYRLSDERVSSIHKSISMLFLIAPVENPTNFDEVISNEMKEDYVLKIQFTERLDSDYYNFQRVTLIVWNTARRIGFTETLVDEKSFLNS